MDDDKKLPQDSDSMFDEHELDLNTPDDLEAVEDLTFNETPQDPDTSMFDEFEDFNTLDKMVATEDTAALAELEEPEAYPRVDESPHTAIPMEEFTFGDEEAFDFSSLHARSEPVTSPEEDIFTSDAFEDVTAEPTEDVDFPEEESSDKLGDSQLFDYDPNSDVDAVQPEEMYDDAVIPPVAATGGSGKKSGGNGDKAAAFKKLFKNRRAMRIALMFVLVGVVYGLLRLFTGGSSTNTMQASAPLSQPKSIATHTETKSTTETHPVPEIAAAPAVSHPAAVGAPPAAHETTPPATPAEQHPAHETISSTTTTVATTPTAVPVPGATHPAAAIPPVALAPATVPIAPHPSTTVTTTTSSTTQPPQTTLIVQQPTSSDQISDKLSSLQASIMAIDDRLNTLSASKTKAKVGELSPGASMGNPFGTPGPEDHKILLDALHKIEGIDAKMSYIAQLETQVHILSKEVNALKGDVVQQSMIVGNAQAAINQNLSSVIDMKAPKMIVQAAIPGRAWLRSETGQLLTVIAGDEVPGYGRVVSIDPVTGTVVMSSRAVFRE